MMKRFRVGEDTDIHSVDMAGVLMLLSRGRRDDETSTKMINNNKSSSCSRVFECKTCNRQFPSFQALGGHRASHKKLRPLMIPEEEEEGQGQAGRGQQQKVHECSICGLEFAIGQALGGHMRRHRGPEGSAAGANDVGEKISSRKVWLDLNLPPSMSMEEEMECRKMQGFGLTEINVEPAVPMVDYCLY